MTGEFGLEFSPADIRNVLVSHRSEIMAASELTLSDGGKEYHPNYLVSSAFNAFMWFNYEKDNLAGILGKGNYRMVSKVVSSLQPIARELHEAAIEGYLSVSEDLASPIINAYFALMEGVAAAFRLFSGVSREGLEKRVAEDVDKIRLSLAAVVGEANALFNSATTAEFLSHVKRGAVDPEYQSSLVAKAIGQL